MKIAFCLHGGIGQIDKRSDNVNECYVDPELCYNQFKHYNILQNNYDVFFHTWNSTYNNKIVSLYDPKKYQIEENKTFDTDTTGYRIYGTWSRYYSLFRANELKKKYEIENNIKYDYVFHTRFDVAFLTQLDFTDYDNNYLYAQHTRWLKRKNKDAANWNKHHISDWWFFSNSQTMDDFCNLYKNLHVYLDTKNLPVQYRRHGSVYSWSPQHLVARKHINSSDYKNKVRYILYRDDDNCLARQIYHDQPCYSRDRLWYNNNGIYSLYDDIHKELDYNIFTDEVYK
jgi:hypothetical protein